VDHWNSGLPEFRIIECHKPGDDESKLRFPLQPLDDVVELFEIAVVHVQDAPAAAMIDAHD